MIGGSGFSRRIALTMMGAAAVGGGCSRERAASSMTSPSTTQPTTTATTTSTTTTDDGSEPPAAGEWLAVSPEAAGFTEAGLAELLTLVGNSKSQSFLLLWDGRRVAEQYWR